MIDLERLKPILQELIPEESMSDAVLRVKEIDEEMDNSALENLTAENNKLREQNKKLTDIFFTGKKEEFDDAALPDEPNEDVEEEPDTFDELFEEVDYKKEEK